MLRLQSDERLIALVRRGNVGAFEALVGRYEARLLAFCRHLLGSREDAEDILQEVMAAAFNAILADERPIKVRPWLYRIARNRCLNHLRRNQAMGVDSMDVHFSDNGASTADKVHEREEFRLLVGDIHELPETQRTALVLREMDALSYEQIAEAMETTVPSVKSLLVRARVSLAEAAEARLLSCEEVRLELGEVAEGLRRRPGALVRRHLRSCDRCSTFRVQLRDTNKALAALLPFGPLVVLKKLAFTHLGHSAGSSAAGSGAAGSGAAAGSGTAAAGSAMAASGAGGVVSAGIGAVATKAVAGLAVTAIVTAGAVEVGSSGRKTSSHHAVASVGSGGAGIPLVPPAVPPVHHLNATKPKTTAASKKANTQSDAATKASAKSDAKSAAAKLAAAQAARANAVAAGRTVVNNDTTNLASGACGSAVATSTTPTSTTPTGSAGCSSTPTSGGVDSSGGTGGATTTPGTTSPTDGTGTATTSDGTPPVDDGKPPADGGGTPPPDGGGATPPTPGGTTGGGATPPPAGGGTPPAGGGTPPAPSGTPSGGPSSGSAPLAGILP